EQAADHQHREREKQVQSTNVFVVGGKQPPTPAGGSGVVCVVVCCTARSVSVAVDNCAHSEFLNAFRRCLLSALCHNFGGLHKLAGLVGPGILGVRGDRSQFCVAVLLPGRHGTVGG